MKKLLSVLGLSFLAQLNGHAGWHEMLSDNGFELQSSYWSAYVLAGGDTSSSAGIVNLGNAHTGTWYGYVGDYNISHHNAVGAIKQLVGVPPGATKVKLSFYLNVTSQETTTTNNYDTMGAYLRTILGDSAVVSFHQWSNTNKDVNGIPNNYIQQNYTNSIVGYAGTQMTFQFYAQTDPTYSTTFRIDDVSLQAYLPEYTISSSAGPNGTISPSGNTIAEYGQTLTFTATPAQNYTVDSWYANGNLQATGGTTLRLGVGGNTSMYVTFKPIVYTVSVSAGANGSVSPNGDVPVNAGSDLNLTATPAANYAVDTWYRNGIAVQTGGNTFKWENVIQSGSVSVTFGIPNYSLSISASHGTVQVSTAKGGHAKANYASGTQLILTPVPDPGWAFAGWGGDIAGGAQPYYLLMNANKSVTPFFVSQVSPTAMSTPMVIVQPNGPGSQCSLPIPTIAGWKYCVKVSRNGPGDWTYLTTFIGSGSTTTVTDTRPAGPTGNYYSWTAEPYSDGSPFLHFPITNDNGDNVSPYEAEIRAVFDNDVGPVDEQANGHILLFTGQSLVFDPATARKFELRTQITSACDHYPIPGYRIGYQQDVTGTPVSLGLPNYDDEDGGTPGKQSTIWYDGHTGYDYAYGTAWHVVAAAAGKIDSESSHTRYNQLVIRHDLQGYKTYYVHLSKWEKEFNVGDDVAAGQRIGSPGNIDETGAPNGPIHLHFTVKKQGTDGVYRRVDPYGLKSEDNKFVNPILWLNHP